MALETALFYPETEHSLASDGQERDMREENIWPFDPLFYPLENNIRRNVKNKRQLKTLGNTRFLQLCVTG